MSMYMPTSLQLLSRSASGAAGACCGQAWLCAPWNEAKRGRGLHSWLLLRASQSAAKCPPGFSRISSGGPASASLPAFITMMRSQCMMVSRRCAMVMTVEWLSSLRSVRWMTSSVSMSTDAVASSSTMTRDCLSSARHMHSSWRCPIDRLPPRSSICRSSFSGCSCIGTSIEHWRRACQICASVCSEKGSRLYRSVPVKSTGSCGMIARRARRSPSASLEMSSPSMQMVPERSSDRRKRHTKMEDLPAPVRPTIPTFSIAPISRLSPVSTSGRSGR
mmetsp:Transcript_44135/g.107264  ORF Transcript_44135/g.107264 Transcript_44135/m.107264 type:complete len:276 (+) Transcript_44135:311-1138(+)